MDLLCSLCGAEVHLKQLDSSISKLETSYCTDTEPTHSNTEVAERKAPMEADMMAPSSGEDLKFEVNAGVTIDENCKVEEPATTSSTQNPQDWDAAAVPSKVESENDEDMDIEMELDGDNVKEQVHSSSVPNKEHPPSEKVDSPNLPPLESPAPLVDNDDPPPPPEEEWIPPPPDNEPAPPAPPEDPVASYVHADIIPQPYIGQADADYTHSVMEYYSAGGTEGIDANYYMQASEAHTLQAQQLSYYAPVSASGISVPVDGTSIAPAYYAYPSVTMATNGVAAEHSGYYASSISAISSSAADMKTTSTYLVSANINSDPTCTWSGSDKVISKDASVAPLSQAALATSASGATSILGSSTQPYTGTTNQTKVIRGKKRAVAVTSSLRSNKKVSSLVDKVALYNKLINAVITLGCK